MRNVEPLGPHLVAALEPAETIEVTAWATNAVLALSARRLFVVDADRVLLALPIRRIRRIEFDIERSRPATLVIVPEDPTEEPQVLAIPPASYEAAAKALALVGQRLAAEGITVK